MADTAAGAVRDALVASGAVGDRVFRYSAPEGVPFPYVTFNDAVSVAQSQRGDGTTEWWVRQVQIDLWELLRDSDPVLARDIVAALNGTRVTVAGAVTMSMSVDSVDAIPEPYDTGIAHRAISATVVHDSSAL